MIPKREGASAAATARPLKSSLTDNNSKLAQSPTPIKQFRGAVYWRRRRQWWATHKRGLGTDWASINTLQVEIAAFLADLSGMARVGDASCVTFAAGDIDADQYDGPSSTFAHACREADRKRATSGQILPFRQRDRDYLPTSTRQAVDWLLKYGDEQRLEIFLTGRPAAELVKIHHYIKVKLNADHSQER